MTYEPGNKNSNKKTTRYEKTVFTFFLAFLLLSMVFTGCSTQNEPTTDNSGNQDQTSYNVNPSGTDSEKNDDPTGSGNDSSSSGGQTDSDSDVPIVYMTADISPEGLMAVYEALDWTSSGSVAVKLSTGEPPASSYLRPELIKDLVQSVSGTIVECNTAYGGSRSETAMHYQVAEDHGFTGIADFQILDEDGSMTLPVNAASLVQRIESRNGLHTLEYAEEIFHRFGRDGAGDPHCVLHGLRHCGGHRGTYNLHQTKKSI